MILISIIQAYIHNTHIYFYVYTYTAPTLLAPDHRFMKHTVNKNNNGTPGTCEYIQQDKISIDPLNGAEGRIIEADKIGNLGSFTDILDIDPGSPGKKGVNCCNGRTDGQ